MWASFLLLLQSGCIPVAGDRILAADLAPFAEPFRRLDGSAFVAYAPLPGLERRWTRRELQALVPGVEEKEFPHSLCVIRAAAPLREGEVAAAMRASLPADARMEIVRLPRWPLPAGRLEFLLSGLRRSASPGRYQWKGRLIPHGGGRPVPVVAEVRLELVRPVLIARRRVEAGAVIDAGALALEERDAGLPEPPPAADPSAFSGWRTRRALEEGRPVRVQDLIPPEAARAGEMILLTAETEGARVAVQAQALTAGRIGQRVIVETRWNRRKIEARMIAPGRAVAERGRR